AGLFGFLGYELVDQFEPLPARRPDPLGEADAELVLGADFALYDHRAGTVAALSRGLPFEGQREAAARHAGLLAALQQPAPPTPRFRDAAPTPADFDVDDAAFQSGVRALQRHVEAGDVFQAVLSRGCTTVCSVPSLRAYRALAQRNPSPYLFHLDLEQGQLLGSSPETFVRVQGGQVELRPIAGTAPRGFAAEGTIDEDLDARLALALLGDDKERAEHAMLLDLARNDVARIARPGSTRVVQQFALERYSHVQHLVSRVRGELR